MGIAAIGGLLSGASGLLGAFGKGKSQSGQQFSESGYQFNPEQKKQIAATLMGLFPKIGEQADRPYIGNLFRRGVDETDTDPVFGSKRRVQWAGEMDKLRELIAQQGVGTTPAAVTVPQENDYGLDMNFVTPRDKAFLDLWSAPNQPYPQYAPKKNKMPASPTQDPVTQAGVRANVQDLLKKIMEK